MNYKKSDLSNCVIDDYVYTCSNGWVQIRALDKDKVVTTKDNLYFIDGKKYRNDLYPCVWTFNPFDPHDKQPCQFEDGDEVIVWQEHNQKCKRIFAYKKFGMFYCYIDGQNKWTSDGRVTEWENCIVRVKEEV